MSKKNLCFFLCFSCVTLIVSPANAWDSQKTLYTIAATSIASLITGATLWGVSERNNQKRVCPDHSFLSCCAVSTFSNGTKTYGPCQPTGDSPKDCNDPSHKALCVNPEDDAKETPYLATKSSSESMRNAGLSLTVVGAMGCVGLLVFVGAVVCCSQCSDGSCSYIH